MSYVDMYSIGQAEFCGVFRLPFVVFLCQPQRVSVSGEVLNGARVWLVMALAWEQGGWGSGWEEGH